jgi:pimeloyl-ACP methyl ester carboxylesterase
MRVASLVAAAVLASCLVGCNNGLARQMVTAPNKRLSTGPSTEARPMEDDRIFVKVDAGDGAVIAGWVLEPKLAPGETVKGTVLVLHGFLGNRVFVRSTAEKFAEAGYRAVLIDLRGHGDSTGRHVSFGVFESRDMVQVLDYLQKHGLAGETVGVYGTSLGAAVGILWSAIDPRVKAVVAIAPFTNLREEAPYFLKNMLPLPGAFISEKDMTEILARAAEIAHFNPDDASPLDAIKRSHAKILLIHGTPDRIIPVEHSRRLHAAAPGSELVILNLAGHLAASFDWGGETSKLGREFFDKHLPAASVNE